MISRLTTLAAMLGLTAIVALAQDNAGVQARMKERLPAIDEIKSRQIVGENNHGFLEVRGAASGQQQQVIGAENDDRRAAYAEIAKKTGASADAVGQARARKIAANSAPGVWLQRESGEWYRK